LRAQDELFDSKKHAFVARKINDDFTARVAIRLGTQPEHPPLAVCPLNCADKPGGGAEEPYRVIGNMMDLNEYFPAWKMRFEDLRYFSRVFRPHYFVFNLDKKAAYHTVLCHPRLARYFGFEWDGALWRWDCLPFGFRLSPYVFCKVAKQLVKLWRRDGLAVLPFVDDEEGGAAGFASAVRASNRMLRDNEYYGFTMSTKSSPLPFQRSKFLGYINHLACPTPRFHIPKEKAEALASMASETAQSLGAVSEASSDGEDEVIIDICSGKCSVGKAHRLRKRLIRIIAIDVMDEEEFFAGLPPHMQKEGCHIYYINRDVIELTLDLLLDILMREFGMTLANVVHWHWSPMCETMSRASRGKGRHRWASGHPRSQKARAHDERFRHVLSMLVQVANLMPLTCISVENPLNPIFPYFPEVQALVGLDGWVLVLRADHCMMANACDERAFPNKPSSWLLHGVDDGALDKLVCNPPSHGCRFRLHPRSVLHMLVVCRRKNMHPRQRKVNMVSDKSRVPMGAFHRILDAHAQWKGARVAPSTHAVPMRKVAKIVGRLGSMGLAVAPSQLMSRDLIRMMWSNEEVDWDAWVTADPAAVDELLWIASGMQTWNDMGMPIWREATVVDIVVTQDSSPVGVGFRLESGGARLSEGHFPFRSDESGLDHVHREMLGLVFVFLTKAVELEDRQVQIRVDSMSTVKYVRDKGGPSQVMTYLTKKLWGLAIRHRISIAEVGHISGVEMVRVGVDGLSRPIVPKALSEADRADWRVAPELWCRIVNSMYPLEFTCDRFASRANALLPRFCSLTTEPGALTPPNALAHDWRSNGEGGGLEMNWAFPPLRLVPDVITLLRQQRARACLLVPDWCREWYPAVVEEATWLWVVHGSGPSFQRQRDGQWEDVQQNLFKPLVVLMDFTEAA
jgi:hypothetical protein